MKRFFVLAFILIAVALAGCEGDVAVDSSSGPPASDNTSRQLLLLADDETEPETDDALFKGQIGLQISARKTAAYGHNPATATIELVDDVLPGFPAVVQLGPYSMMGTLSLPVADLSDDEISTYARGINLKITLWDVDGQFIVDRTMSRVVLQSNPVPIEVFNEDLEDKFAKLKLDASTEYFIQRVKGDGTPVDSGWTYNGNQYRKAIVDTAGIQTAMASPMNESAKRFLHQFIEFENDPGYYAIKNVDQNSFVKISSIEQAQGNAGNGNRYKFRQLFLTVSADAPDTNAPNSNSWNRWKFKIEKERNGVYIIKAKISELSGQGDLALRHLDGWPARSPASAASGWGFTTDTEAHLYWYTAGRNQYADNTTATTPTRWRIVSTNIDWEVRSAGAEVVQSIIPAPQIGIAYESDESNCGSQILETETGIERSTETTVYAEWSESLSTLSSQTHTLGWELSMSIDSPVGPSYSASVSGEHSFHTENSRTQTTTTGQSTTETVTFASRKLVKVPQNTIAYIKASYETYDDIEVGFVQRLQLRGADRKTGRYLTGDEIRSQLQTTKFNGVVTSVEEDMVELSIRGTAVVSNLVKGRTSVVERPLDCE
jgi:hypothetical protein